MLLKNAAMKQSQLAHQLTSRHVALQELKRVAVLEEEIKALKAQQKPTEALEKEFEALKQKQAHKNQLVQEAMQLQGQLKEKLKVIIASLLDVSLV